MQNFVANIFLFTFAGQLYLAAHLNAKWDVFDRFRPCERMRKHVFAGRKTQQAVANNGGLVKLNFSGFSWNNIKTTKNLEK